MSGKKETLRAWLLCRGRREEVAGLLHVHPQTVRYRVGQLRELYGERLDDPESVLESYDLTLDTASSRKRRAWIPQSLL